MSDRILGGTSQGTEHSQANRQSDPTHGYVERVAKAADM